MQHRLSSVARLPKALLAVSSLLAAGSPLPIGAAPARAATSGTVLQTNLVSDLPGAAAVTDPNLVNSWGISESGASPFWISDNNAGLTTLYNVPGPSNTPVSVNPLAVNIPTPVSFTGGAPTGTVFNTSSGGFTITGPNKMKVTVTAPAVFLFATEDGTIVGWNPGIDPTGKFAGPNGFSEQAVVAKDNSGNNFTQPDPTMQTGAVYKGLAIATTTTPIVSGNGKSTALLYAANFRAGTIDVYGTDLKPVSGLSAGAFTDPGLPAGYAPFNVQVLDGKLYVSYAVQNATRHDDLAGPHRGFVDVFNFDGSPGLPGKAVRLISHGVLDSPWGLAIAPPGFAGLSAPGGDPVLLVGNFGDGLIHAFDATTPGPGVGQLTDPDGEPIRIDGLWALKVGNGGMGGSSNTVYFTAGPFGESHGLFGSLATATPGSPEGTAESQWVQANADVVQRDAQQLVTDTSGGAPVATIKQDNQTLATDTHALVHAEEAFTDDTVSDSAP